MTAQRFWNIQVRGVVSVWARRRNECLKSLKCLEHFAFLQTEKCLDFSAYLRSAYDTTHGDLAFLERWEPNTDWISSSSSAAALCRLPAAATEQRDGGETLLFLHYIIKAVLRYDAENIACINPPPPPPPSQPNGNGSGLWLCILYIRRCA